MKFKNPKISTELIFAAININKHKKNNLFNNVVLNIKFLENGFNGIKLLNENKKNILSLLRIHQRFKRQILIAFVI